MFSIIVAKDHNNIIGINGKLAYSFKKDLSFFKETTKKHTVVMGHNTYVSIGKPLEDRDNIILTRDASLEIDNCIVLYDKDTIQQFINDNKDTEDEIFIIGGESIYRLFLPYVKKIYCTLIDNKKLIRRDEEVSLFPDFPTGKFNLISSKQCYDIDRVSRIKFKINFNIYSRIG